MTVTIGRRELLAALGGAAAADCVARGNAQSRNDRRWLAVKVSTKRFGFPATPERPRLPACHWPMPPVLPIERIACLSYGRRLLRCLAYDIRFSCGKPL